MNKSILIFLVAVMVVALVGSFLPASAQKVVTIMRARHFVEGFEQQWHRIAQEFERMNPGVKVRVDYTSKAELEMKEATEAETGKGHDIVESRMAGPYLYTDLLEDVDDVIERIAAQSGAPIDLAKEYAFVDGHWKAVPVEFFPSILCYRSDYWQQVGYSKEKIWQLTWDELIYTAAPKLQSIGHPFSVPMSQIKGDTYHWMSPFMWSFASYLVDKDLNVIIDSANTYTALKKGKDLYQHMTPGVLAWDPGSDNRFMLSGVGAGVVNSGSIWHQVKEANLPFWEEILYAPLPSGPAGRFIEGFIVQRGIWKFAENKKEAKDFLAYMFTKENALAIADACMPGTVSAWSGIALAIEEGPRQRASEAFTPLVGEVHHGPDWPGPVTGAASKIWTQAIIPIMFGKVAAGMSIQEAMDWAEKKLEEIYQQERVKRK